MHTSERPPLLRDADFTHDGGTNPNPNRYLELRWLTPHEAYYILSALTHSPQPAHWKPTSMGIKCEGETPSRQPARRRRYGRKLGFDN